MKLEVQVISNEIITPSSPTPHHLRTYHLSSLDLIMPHGLVPHFLFYPFRNNLMSISDRTSQLKQSLSQVLTLFYPLAGRLLNDKYINCNDEGVTFTEARANCKLCDLLDDLTVVEFNKFRPFDIHEYPTDHPMVIQATFFECGGLALGVAISHQVADGWSYFMFLKSWAATSRGDARDILSPIFNSPTLFPPRDLGTFDPRTFYTKDKHVFTKRFVFPALQIEELRDKYTKKENDGNEIIPTRVEALSAFISTRFKVSIQAKDESKKTYMLVHAVNMRTKVVPPLPENSFGNMIQQARTFVSSKDVEEGNLGVVEKIRAEIRNLGGDQVTRLREINESLRSFKDRAKMPKSEVVALFFTSICRFPLYNTDFGWGKPVWVATDNTPFKNSVLFQDSVLGDGIEASVNMTPEDMAKFEGDEQLLAYVSSGPHYVKT